MLISANDNARSAYPSGIDTFSNVSDGTGIANVINAEIWDRLETALYRTESHAQRVLHVVSRHIDGNFKRVTVATTGLVAAPALAVTVSVALSAPQVALLAGSPFRYMNSIYAHVYPLFGTAHPYLVTPRPTNLTTVEVGFRNMDLITTVPSGVYAVSLAVLGI